MTISTPSDDPNAPPPPPVTYYTVVWNGTTMTADEQNSFSIYYNSTLTTGNSTPSSTYKYIATSSTTCANYLLTHPLCTGCRNGNALFTLGTAVSSSAAIFVYGGCPF